MPKANEIPACPGRPPKGAPRKETREFEIELVTPMFGGGVEPRVNDSTFPIRPTAIRGQLQFWWRATCGAIFDNTPALFERHSQVWGTTDNPSPIGIVVNKVKAAAAKPCAKYNWNPNAGGGRGGWRISWDPKFKGKLSYALFPFQGEQPTSDGAGNPEKDPAFYVDNCTFTLVAIYPRELRNDVERSVWAWVNFGGIGARARRGCGSLYCREQAPKDRESLPAWFRSRAGVASNPMRAWPTLTQQILVRRDTMSPIDAWEDVVAIYRFFRQGDDFGRDKGKTPQRPGRSRWPEPETLRAVTRQLGHPRLPHIPNDAFPRAELGLPIVFHFPPGRGEPPDTVLYPARAADGEKRDRMASPLILKPLTFADGQAASLIVRLAAETVESVELQKGDSALPLQFAPRIRGTQLSSYKNSPLAKSPSGSAIDAFLALAREENYEEVSL